VGAFVAGVALMACSHRSPLLQPTPEELVAPAPDSFDVTFTTSRGPFVVRAHRDWSPYGADRFYFLAANGYYDQARFFRVVKGFVVQFGISGNPLVNAAWKERTIPDDQVLRSNVRGMMSFARSGPNSRTVQVFINYRDNSRLDTLGGSGFPPFAQVVQGMDVVDSLYSGYGEGPPRGKGPSQDSIMLQGNPYLQRAFPKMDYIQSARVTQQWLDTLDAITRLQRGFPRPPGGRRPRPGREP
jgi:peptidyl-prolyl cis-trans isomerase A (cyclophilin A)